MTPQGFTGLLIALITILVILYDVVVCWIWGRGPSITNVIIIVSREWLIIPFAAGVLIGHLFFPALNTAVAVTNHLLGRSP